MSRSTYSISGLAAAAIVLLRIGVGAHFLSEGWSKIENPKPFSAGFFANAKGPFAPVYKNMVWDADGLYRLDADGTIEAWTNYRDEVVAHYDFDEKQAKAASDVVKRFESRLKAFVGGKNEEIVEYQNFLQRRDDNAEDPARKLASLQKHDVRINTETAKLRAALVPPIDGLWKDLEADLNAIATEDQWASHGRVAISKPGRSFGDSEMADRFVPWFDAAIGVCLILGFLTRPAAVLGALFLASICASQWPLAPGAAPIWNQAIEMLAMLTLAAVGAGRFLGIDALFSRTRGNVQFSTTPKTNPIPNASITSSAAGPRTGVAK